MDYLYSENEITDIASKIVATLRPSETQATVLALQGDLGAGKTTLTKIVAEKLGVRETIVSPTFVIAKFYPAIEYGFENLVHIDAYRIESLSELEPLGWGKILQQPRTLVVVEWPEKIAEALPKEKTQFTISHENDKRRIKQLS